jgi:hypothetical protein
MIKKLDTSLFFAYDDIKFKGPAFLKRPKKQEEVS